MGLRNFIFPPFKAESLEQFISFELLVRGQLHLYGRYEKYLKVLVIWFGLAV